MITNRALRQRLDEAYRNKEIYASDDTSIDAIEVREIVTDVIVGQYPLDDSFDHEQLHLEIKENTIASLEYLKEKILCNMYA